MPLLSTSEALHVSDSFLSSLYGDDIFRRWKELKDEMKFFTEREYVSWLIDVANHYKNEDESQQLSQESDTTQYIPKSEYHVNIEQNCNEENTGEMLYVKTASQNNEQVEGPEMPMSEYSHLSSTQDTRNSQNYSEQFTLDTKVEGAGNSNEQTSVTSQVDDYKYEQSYYDDVREEGMLEMETNEIMLSSDEELSGANRGEAAFEDVQNGSIITSPVSHGVASRSREKRYQCPYCSYSTNNSSGMINRHITAVHQRLKPFVCHICQYRSARKGNLRTHLLQRHGCTMTHTEG